MKNLNGNNIKCFSKKLYSKHPICFQPFLGLPFLFFFLPCPKEYWPTPPLLLSFFPSFWSEAKEI
jgi:hypothetical protein